MTKIIPLAEEEKEKILANYFKSGKNGELDVFPSKEKRKLIVLENIVNHFNLDRIYSEKEVNEILKPIYTDFAIIRRSLIDYDFMERNQDCTEYWIKAKVK
ncbi:MAG TPA: DUF2087 domain-containing protein [Virgibacillus sp.]|nr:DUF2087 domain-containing protein [Virgibacillus sp.]HLR68833.1 DUF2087 domain-containing protein [Virgibacillus sp.]